MKLLFSTSFLLFFSSTPVLGSTIRGGASLDAKTDDSVSNVMIFHADLCDSSSVHLLLSQSSSPRSPRNSINSLKMTTLSSLAPRSLATTPPSPAGRCKQARRVGRRWIICIPSLAVPHSLGCTSDTPIHPTATPSKHAKFLESTQAYGVVISSSTITSSTVGQ